MSLLSRKCTGVSLPFPRSPLVTHYKCKKKTPNANTHSRALQNVRPLVFVCVCVGISTFQCHVWNFGAGSEDTMYEKFLGSYTPTRMPYAIGRFRLSFRLPRTRSDLTTYRGLFLQQNIKGPLQSFPPPCLARKSNCNKCRFSTPSNSIPHSPL